MTLSIESVHTKGNISSLSKTCLLFGSGMLIITVLDWCANWPDLSPVENLWGIVKRDTRPNNKAEGRYKGAWASITPNIECLNEHSFLNLDNAISYILNCSNAIFLNTFLHLEGLGLGLQEFHQTREVSIQKQGLLNVTKITIKTSQDPSFMLTPL